MQIITNNVPRVLVAFADLPIKAQADFDYVEELAWFDPRFVQYKGCWYDVDDTQGVRYSRGGSAMTEFNGWDLFVSETFFSGVLFRLVEDDQVIVGRYFS